MSISEKVIKKYGEDMTIGQTAAKGFISAVNKYSPDTEAILPNGVKELSGYKLITDLPDLCSGMNVSCSGREYVILRVEPVRISGKFSHNECLLRLKGGTQNA